MFSLYFSRLYIVTLLEIGRDQNIRAKVLETSEQWVARGESGWTSDRQARRL
jgi:hypothetical protein